MIAPLPWSRFNLRYRRCQQSFLCRLPFHTSVEESRNLACGAADLGIARKPVRPCPGRNEVWSFPFDSSRPSFFTVAPTTRPCHPEAIRQDGRRISTANGADPVPPNVASLLTTGLRVVVSQPRLSRLLAFIQCHPFPAGQFAAGRERCGPDASLGKLLFSLSRSRHLRTLLENCGMVHC